jgi:hypothetical protein
MIITEKYEEFDFIHSDNGFYMIRDDGEKISEALDIPGTHTYTETDEKIGEKQDYEKALRILLGIERE